MSSVFKQPIKRGALRKLLGRAFYAFKRHLHWMMRGDLYRVEKREMVLPYLIFTHKTPIHRPLKDVDPWLQVNKEKNIRIAMKRLDGSLLKPGSSLSYWRQIGNPTKAKGYVPGMVLDQGAFRAETGGGLCQLSNLLFWMTLHTPLTVTERWRHGYDVFPDANRTQPFGSGATCYYPFLDLVVKNETAQPFQLRVFIEEGFLVGEWRSCEPSACVYRIEERDHRMVQAPWGGYIRMNTLVRVRVTKEGDLMDEEVIAKNEAVMMYDPLLPSAA